VSNFVLGFAPPTAAQPPVGPYASSRPAASESVEASQLTNIQVRQFIQSHRKIQNFPRIFYRLNLGQNSLDTEQADSIRVHLACAGQ
jgi:hypothetical protein